MAELRFKGFQAGENLGTVAATVSGSSGSTGIAAFARPQTVSGLPRLTSGQYNDETASLDTTGVTGIAAYDWREVGGATRGTSATLNLSGLEGQWLECAVTANEGTLVSPPFLVHSMMNASHAADEKAILALVAHHEATHIAVQSGNWTETSTWRDGRVPRNGARVLIPRDITVTYNQNRLFRLDWVRVDGSLIWSLTQSTYFLVGTLIVTRNATMELSLIHI